MAALEEDPLGASPSRLPTMAEIGDRVVGRELELELILAAVATGRDLLLEGPPGTSKTTLLRAITAAWDIPLVIVEGSAELTPGRLIGHHDPARVLQEGYTAETFVAGPLVTAMLEGGFLYFEEFNRAPEDTLNALLTAIADREITVPRLGTVQAATTFRLVGSMNPYDNVGTTRLSVSIKDRLCRLEIDYQDSLAERQVVALRCGVEEHSEMSARIIADAVTVTRRTRSHDAVQQGSSVRGAIDLFLIARHLCAERRIDPIDEQAYRLTFLQAMMVGLSGRMLLDQASGVDAATVLREIWEQHFVLDGALAEPGPNTVELDDAAPLTRRPDPGRADRAMRRPRPKELTEAPELLSGTGGQGLATGADRDRGERPAARPPGSTTVFGDEEAGLDDEEGEQAGRSATARAAAREIAIRLAAVQPRQARPRRGGGQVTSVPYGGDSDELDMDRTLDAVAERRPLRSEDLIVRERRRRRRSLVLAVDVSGSMKGDRLHTAAATVGGLSAQLVHDRLAVIAFWSDAAVLLRLGERATLEELVDSMLGLRASGLTNVCFPLEFAAEELRRADDSEHRVVLLSDCVHNAGPDPREAVAALPRLDVLFDVSGERDEDLARDLARLGRGLVAPIRGHRDVAPALSRVLTT